jgi:PAS domain S-box-containing protein
MKALIKKPEVWITLIYLVSGFVWIILCDGLLEELALNNKMDIRRIQTLQIWKGISFVIVTGVLLLILLHHYFKRLKRALLDAKELFELSPNAMMVLDLDSKTLLKANDAAVVKYGYTLVEFEGMPVSTLSPKGENDLFEANFHLVSNKLKGDAELKHKLKNGKLVSSHAFWSTIEYKGKNCRIFTFIDITEKKEKERKLRIQESNQQALINNTQDLFWSLDRNFKLLSFNKAFGNSALKVFGVQLRVGDEPLELGSSLIGNATWKPLFEKAFEGDSFSTELITEYPIGNTIYLEVNFNPIFTENDDIEGACCFIHDVTSRKERENTVVNQLNQLREIAWIQSHKVRTPVANILGLTSLLKGYDENESKEHLNELLQMIHQSAEQLDDIIEEVVKLSHNIKTTKI